MTALERAARFVRHHAAATALVIVPLATASTASASVILNPGTATPTSAGPVAPVGGSASFATVANGGIKFFGTQGYDVSASGGGYALGLVLEGTGSGTLDMASIAAHYDFTLTPVSAASTSFNGSIEFFINGASRGLVTGLGASASGNLALSGWTPDEALTSWSVILQGDFNGVGGEDLTLDVPNNSISLTPGRAVVAPEPALLLLVGCALVAGARRRYR